MGQALEVAEYDRCTILLREPIELFVKNRGELVSILVVSGCHWPLVYPPLMSAATDRRPLLTARDAQGHPMEPAHDRPSLADRGGLADQDQEGRLKGILGIVPFAKDRLTDPQDHRTVSLDQGRKRQLG